MEDVMYEIIGGAVIIGIVILVISVFRSSSDVVKKSAESQNQLDAVAIEDTIGYSGLKYGGEKVKDAMAYADLTPGVEVYYYTGTGTPSYTRYKGVTDKEAVKKEFLNRTNEKYQLTITYHSEVAPAASATVGNAGDRIKGDLDIACIRFIYKKVS